VTAADPHSRSTGAPQRDGSAGRADHATGPEAADDRTDESYAYAGDTIPVYVISIAAELSGMHPQTLRQYDRLGLVSPDRAAGRGRRYSSRDIAVLRAVQRLSHEEGVNLAGIKRILELEAEVDELRQRVGDLTDELAEAHNRAEQLATEVARTHGRRYLPVPATTTSGALVVWAPSRHDH